MDCVYIALLLKWAHSCFHTLTAPSHNASMPNHQGQFQGSVTCSRTPGRAGDVTTNLLCPLSPQSGEVMIYLDLLVTILFKSGVGGGK